MPVQMTWYGAALQGAIHQHFDSDTAQMLKSNSYLASSGLQVLSESLSESQPWDAEVMSILFRRCYG